MEIDINNTKDFKFTKKDLDILRKNKYTNKSYVNNEMSFYNSIYGIITIITCLFSFCIGTYYMINAVINYISK